MVSKKCESISPILGNTTRVSLWVRGSRRPLIMTRWQNVSAWMTRYEEYAIHDYELPFEIDEYTPIEEVNRLCEMVENLPEDIQDELSELLGYYSSLEDLCEHADDIIHYPDCSDMTDVAYYFIDECQSLGEIPDRIRSYIDYEAYGRDLDLEGRFVVTNHGVFECPITT